MGNIHGFRLTKKKSLLGALKFLKTCSIDMRLFSSNIAIFLGRHLVSLYYKSVDRNQDEQLDMDILRDYIAYAKQTFNPKITDEAGALLTQSYVNMRQIGAGRGQITAYPR